MTSGHSELRSDGYAYPTGPCLWVSREWFLSTLNVLRDLMQVGGGHPDNYVSADAQRREKTVRWALAVATYVLSEAPAPLTGMSVKWLVRSLNEMGLLDEALKDMDDEEEHHDDV